MLKFDYFTATLMLHEIKFWQIQTAQKCHFLAILEFLILILVTLSNFQVPNLPKIQSSESLKLPKMTFLDRLNLPKCDFA